LGNPPYSYSWDFGDDTTSSEASPRHVYQEVGPWDDWRWGTPAGGAHSGQNAWATVLEGDYHPQQGEDVRYIIRSFGLPCVPEVAIPTLLRFWERHDFAARAIGYVDAITPEMDVVYPAPADQASAYNGMLGGVAGYAGSSGGWRRVGFDLSPWSCAGGLQLRWNLRLRDAAETADGWTIDDVLVESFQHGRGYSSFVAGPLAHGELWAQHDGVGGCASSPGSLMVGGRDAGGNPAPWTEVGIVAAPAGDGCVFWAVDVGQPFDRNQLATWRSPRLPPLGAWRQTSTVAQLLLQEGRTYDL